MGAAGWPRPFVSVAVAHEPRTDKSSRHGGFALRVRVPDSRYSSKVPLRMDDISPQILGLRLAAQRRRRAEEERHAASSELRRRVLDAREAGIPITRMAREAGLSRQAIYEMLGMRLHSARGGPSLP